MNIDLVVRGGYTRCELLGSKYRRDITSSYVCNNILYTSLL